MRFAILLLLAAVLSGDDKTALFNKPPAKVDKALRARIAEFYQDHVKQDFRRAETLVAEDTKNFFYQQNKPTYLSFEIRNIEYADNFKRAKATVLCEQYVMMPGFADKPLQVPVPSTWKLEKGKWYWYVDQSALANTPFGRMKPGPPLPNGAAAPPPSLPAIIPDRPDIFMNKVKNDKSSLTLKPGESGQVTFTNTAMGPMNLSVLTPLKGVEAKLDPAGMAAGGRAVLTLRAGEAARSGVLNIKVEQTGEVIPIQIVMQ